jgi:hypothetical protein
MATEIGSAVSESARFRFRPRLPAVARLPVPHPLRHAADIRRALPHPRLRVRGALSLGCGCTHLSRDAHCVDVVSGYCPQQKYGFGHTYGSTTRNLLQDRRASTGGLLDSMPLTATSVAAASVHEYTGPQLSKPRSAIPGYTGPLCASPRTALLCV